MFTDNDMCRGEAMEYPPVRLVQSRKRTILLILCCLAFVAGSLFVFFYGSPESRLAGFLGVGFFGVLGLPVCFYMLVRPMYLLLDEDGFEMPLAGKRTHRSRWADIAGFEVASLSGNSVVAITYRPDAAGGSAGREIAEQVFGAGGVINAAYGGLKAEQLCGLLESYRAHYGGRT